MVCAPEEQLPTDAELECGTNGMTIEEMRRHRDTKSPLFAQYRFARNARHFHYTRNLKENDLPPVGIGSADAIFRDIILFNGRAARALGGEYTPRYYPAYDDDGVDAAFLRLAELSAGETSSPLENAATRVLESAGRFWRERD